MLTAYRRTSRVRLVLAAVLVLGVAAAAAAQARPPAARNFLWKVQSGSQVLYLAGSVHALTAEVYPLPAAYQQAFDAAGTLVEEIDLGDNAMLAAGPMMMAKGVYRDGRTFQQVVSKDTAALVAARLNGSVP